MLAGLAKSSLARVNYRKREVVAGLGLLLVLGLLVWAAPLAVVVRVDPLRALRAGLLAPSGLAVVVGMVWYLWLHPAPPNPGQLPRNIVGQEINPFTKRPVAAPAAAAGADGVVLRWDAASGRST